MTCCDTKQPTTPSHAFGACVPGALPGGLLRTRFFDGMVLTQADLENEQRFWRIKRRLTNRALGEGVVWGLRLRWDARRRMFQLGPGYALDCCGNDLIVECPIEVTETDLIKLADPALKAAKVNTYVNRAEAIANPIRQACVVLQYVECPEDARPVHLDPCTPPTTRCEPSRIRETTRLLLVPPPMPDPDNCLDQFFDELQAIKDSITDPQLRDQLFPPPAPPGPNPFPDPTAQLPATLRISVVGSGANTSVTLQPPANGTVSGGGILGIRTPPANALRAGVVQFELRPHAEWGFTQGRVTEGGVPVDIVAPPVDLHQFWSLEVTLPDGVQEVTERFEYHVENLGLERVFGDHASGIANLVIRGEVAVRPSANGIETSVKLVSVESKSDIADPIAGKSCLEHLEWGFMADPQTGEQDAKLLLLAAVYAYFADVSNQSGGAWTPQRAVAAALYAVAWRLLGVNVSIPNAEAQKQELARILAHLFQCWCDAMLYPGPRCASEHHGVYLGCATVGPNGQILTFDMWEHRRHVLLGPLVNHWLGVFGLAPIDVIAGRLAQTICCIAGLPLPAIPGRGQRPQPQPIDLTRGPSAPTAPPTVIGGASEEGVPLGRGTMWVSSRGSSQPAREIGRSEFVRRMVSAFVAESTAPLARFRTRLGDGAIAELLAPNAERAAHGDHLEPRVRALFDRDDRLRPLAESAARVATIELAREVPPTAVPELSGPAAELAKLLSASGLTLAGLVDAGAAGLFSLARDADPNAVDDLAARADKALDGVADGVAKGLEKAKADRPSVMLRDGGARTAIANDLTKRFVGLTRANVEAALERAASRTS